MPAKLVNLPDWVAILVSVIALVFSAITWYWNWKRKRPKILLMPMLNWSKDMFGEPTPKFEVLLSNPTATPVPVKRLLYKMVQQAGRPSKVSTYEQDIQESQKTIPPDSSISIEIPDSVKLRYLKEIALVAAVESRVWKRRWRAKDARQSQFSVTHKTALRESDDAYKCVKVSVAKVGIMHFLFVYFQDTNQSNQKYEEFVEEGPAKQRYDTAVQELRTVYPVEVDESDSNEYFPISDVDLGGYWDEL